jgi:hypothetical protein
MASDAEHPPAYRLVAAAHPVQVSGDLEEDLARYIFGIGDLLCPQVSHNRRSKLAVDQRRISIPVSAHHVPIDTGRVSSTTAWIGIRPVEIKDQSDRSH